jgi:valyl-tRNA synthetase
MDRYGADALRFTLARGANPGTDVPIGEEWVAGSRNFATKLWNATRFALSRGAQVRELPSRAELTDADRWILDRLDVVVAEVDQLLEDFQFAKSTELLYHFTWDEFCDWYLELAKVQLADEQSAAHTQAVLGHVLDVVLRLLHPVIPFITEELWTALTGGESVVIAPWPAPSGTAADPVAAGRIDAVQRLVTEIRRFRNDQGLRPRQAVAGRLTGLDETGLAGLEQSVRALTTLQAPAETFSPVATLQVGLPEGTVGVELDTSGALDVEAECARVGKDLAAAEKELAGTEAKLGNPKFTERAPADVVDKIRARRDTARGEIERLQSRLSALAAREG